MSIVSFYPGPSRLDPQVEFAFTKAYQTGILSVNHRSTDFINLVKDLYVNASQKLNIPEGYQILFASSATECWESIIQSLTDEETPSIHFTNGAFGEKWFDYAQRIGKAVEYKFDSSSINFENIVFDAKETLVCLTHGETSNGQIISKNDLELLRKLGSENIIAVDATATLGGMAIDLSLADIWFASVQKCFGLPAGMAIMIVSPRVQKKVLEEARFKRYNDLFHQITQMNNFQTTHTPNVLNIFLLNEVLHLRKSIEEISLILNERYHLLKSLINKRNDLTLLNNYENNNYSTVLVISVLNGELERIKAEALKIGILLGNGYGKWKSNTFRIANFPSIQEEEFQLLVKWLQNG